MRSLLGIDNDAVASPVSEADGPLTMKRSKPCSRKACVLSRTLRAMPGRAFHRASPKTLGQPPAPHHRLQHL